MYDKMYARDLPRGEVKSVRLNEDEISWVKDYAKKFGIFYKGEPSIGGALRHLIRMEQLRESDKAVSNEDIFDNPNYRKYESYVEWMEQGYPHLVVAKRLGLLKSSSNLEFRYLLRYMTAKRLETQFRNLMVLSFLKTYLGENAWRYVEKLTNEPAQWMAEVVKSEILMIVGNYQDMLEHPEKRSSKFTEEKLRAFLFDP